MGSDAQLAKVGQVFSVWLLITVRRQVSAYKITNLYVQRLRFATIWLTYRNKNDTQVRFEQPMSFAQL